jgi:hypothetical protein
MIMNRREAIIASVGFVMGGATQAILRPGLREKPELGRHPPQVEHCCTTTTIPYPLETDDYEWDVVLKEWVCTGRIRLYRDGSWEKLS